MKFSVGRVFLLMVLLVSACLLGCDSGEKELPWYTDEYGRFITRDLARAREEVPFPIIIPSYLPDNLGEYPVIVGPLKGEWLDNRLGVEVHFLVEKGEDEGWILLSINEWNYPMGPGDPALNPGYFYVEIAGTEVVETEHSIGPFGADVTNLFLGWIFWWNEDGIYFEVAVYGYDRDTTVKIIESMIEQMN